MRQKCRQWFKAVDKSRLAQLQNNYSSCQTEALMKRSQESLHYPGNTAPKLVLVGFRRESDWYPLIATCPDRALNAVYTLASREGG